MSILHEMSALAVPHEIDRQGRYRSLDSSRSSGAFIPLTLLETSKDSNGNAAVTLVYTLVHLISSPWLRESRLSSTFHSRRGLQSPAGRGPWSVPQIWTIRLRVFPPHHFCGQSIQLPTANGEFDAA